MTAETPDKKLTLEPMTQSQAMEATTRLLGSWPQQQPANDEVYKTTMVELLVEYPVWAANNVIKQMARTKKWLPRINQMAEALEAEVRVLRDAEIKAKAAKAQIAGRLPGPEKKEYVEYPRHLRPTYEELKAMYGPNWGINPGPEPKSIMTEEEMKRMQQYNELAKLHPRERPGPTTKKEDWPLTGLIAPVQDEQTARRQPTMAEARDRLIKEFGQDKFDAVPDQPDTFKQLHYTLPLRPAEPVKEPESPPPLEPYVAKDPDDPLEEKWITPSSPSPC